MWCCFRGLQVRFEAFFEMFDRLSSKKISKGEFVRATSIAGIELSTEERDELCTAYEAPGLPDKIRYLDLCDDVNTVFTIKGLERERPSSPVTITSVQRSPALKGTETWAQLEAAEQAIECIKHHAQVNGVVIKNFFKGYDYNNCGAIPRDEFIRALNQLDGKINIEQASALAQAYARTEPNGVELIAYRQLHEDVTDESVFAGASMNLLMRDGLKYNEMVNPEAPHWWQHMDVSMLEDQLATLVAQHRIGRSTASAYFLPHDKFRTGTVPTTRFKVAVRSMFPSVPFTEDMLVAHAAHYTAATDASKTNYARFLASLFEKLGRAGIPASGGSSFGVRDGPKGQLSSSGGFGMGAHFDTVEEPISPTSPRVSLVGNHTMDPSHDIATASPLRKRSVFNREATAMMNAAARATTSEGSGRSPNFGARKSLYTLSRDDMNMSEQDEEAVKALLERIGTVVRNKSIDLKWKMQDFDMKGGSTSTQHEHITSSQFTRVLTELNLLSVPPDYEAGLLIKWFTPSDGRHEPSKYVNYRRFLVAVDKTYSPALHAGSIDFLGESEESKSRSSRPDPLRDQLQMLSIRPSTTVGGPHRDVSEVLASIVEQKLTAL